MQNIITSHDVLEPLKQVLSASRHVILVDVSDIFYFFLFGVGGRGGGVRGGGLGVGFNLKIEGGGGFPRRSRGGEGRWGNACGEGGGKYCF